MTSTFFTLCQSVADYLLAGKLNILNMINCRIVLAKAAAFNHFGLEVIVDKCIGNPRIFRYFSGFMSAHHDDGILSGENPLVAERLHPLDGVRVAILVVRQCMCAVDEAVHVPVSRWDVEWHFLAAVVIRIRVVADVCHEQYE